MCSLCFFAPLMMGGGGLHIYTLDGRTSTRVGLLFSTAFLSNMSSTRLRLFGSLPKHAYLYNKLFTQRELQFGYDWVYLFLFGPPSMFCSAHLFFFGLKGNLGVATPAPEHSTYLVMSLDVVLLFGCISILTCSVGCSFLDLQSESQICLGPSISCLRQ